MLLTDLVAPNAIIPALKVNGKKQALHELAGKAAELSGQSERTILEILQQREKLGSTGVGNGIAIPHGKLPKLTKLFGLFARLERPVDFEALDGQPVDLVFLLLAPETAGADHLKALARVARLLRDPDIARKLRELARRRGALRRAGDAVGKRGRAEASLECTLHAFRAGLAAAAVRLIALTVSSWAARLTPADRAAVRGVQDEHAVPGFEHRRLGAEKRDILRAHRLDVGDPVLAQRRECFGRHCRAAGCGRFEHGTSPRAWGRERRHYRPVRGTRLCSGSHKCWKSDGGRRTTAG